MYAKKFVMEMVVNSQSAGHQILKEKIVELYIQRHSRELENKKKSGGRLWVDDMFLCLCKAD